MDPVTLATLTAGVVVLATEAGKGLAGEAGKGTWKAIQRKLGWSELPASSALAPRVAEALQAQPQLAPEILTLLQQPSIGSAQQLVGTVNAEKVIVANEVGTIQM